MSQHNHLERIDGCPRCELSADEVAVNAPMSQERLEQIRANQFERKSSHLGVLLIEGEIDELLAEVDRLRAELDRARPVLEAARRFSDSVGHDQYIERFWLTIRAWREGDEL